MKILILGSVALPVPPPMQGGTERIAYAQAVGLAKRGHDVTLVAAKGSKQDPTYRCIEIGGGDTVTGSASAVSAQEFTEGSRNLRKELVYMAEVSQWLIDHGKEFDVIVNNMRGGESTLLPVAKSIGVPFATVMHLPLFKELSGLFQQYITPVITISNAQRDGFAGLNYIGTVYNSVDQELLDTPLDANTPRTYLLMVGSIAPHKNQKAGILAAKQLGIPLILAGKIGNAEYWKSEIEPLVDGKTVIHKGEMNLQEKIELYKGAQALLFPILWPEPFGLVMIEAMAVGTPVIAYRNGAVPEVILEGKTGFILEPSGGVAALVSAVSNVHTLDRQVCREHVSHSFTGEHMISALETALKHVRK